MPHTLNRIFNGFFVDNTSRSKMNIRMKTICNETF